MLMTRLAPCLLQPRKLRLPSACFAILMKRGSSSHLGTSNIHVVENVTDGCRVDANVAVPVLLYCVRSRHGNEPAFGAVTSKKSAYGDCYCCKIQSMHSREKQSDECTCQAGRLADVSRVGKDAGYPASRNHMRGICEHVSNNFTIHSI